MILLLVVVVAGTVVTLLITKPWDTSPKPPTENPPTENQPTGDQPTGDQPTEDQPTGDPPHGPSHHTLKHKYGCYCPLFETSHIHLEGKPGTSKALWSNAVAMGDLCSSTINCGWMKSCIKHNVGLKHHPTLSVSGGC